MRTLLKSIWSGMKKGLTSTLNLFRKAVKTVTVPLETAWTKAEKKFPPLKYLRGFWNVFGLYALVILVMSVALVVSAAIQGLIGPAAALSLVASVPFLLLMTFVQQPTLLIAMLAETAALTICTNVLSAWMTSRVSIDTESQPAHAFESHGADEVIDPVTGEIYSRADFRSTPVAAS
jgi:hypothetical protein